jgi:hypothetical protein
MEIGPHLVDGAWSRVDDVEVVHVEILSIALWPAHGIHRRSPVCEVSDMSRSLFNTKTAAKKHTLTCELNSALWAGVLLLQ